MSNKRWDWIEQSGRGGLDASALSKLFKNRADTMSPAVLLVREGIQNSFDASRKYRESSVPFRVRFRFAEYSGKRQREIAEAFGLNELQMRLEGTQWPESTFPVDAKGLQESTGPLRVLYVEDFGAHGLRGPLGWQSGSDLFNAIYMVGTSNKRPDAGGSFGFGKSAIFGAGDLRTVYAYSCFAPKYEEPLEDGVNEKPRVDQATRRAVGFLYWKAHKIGRSGYDGRAELAESPEQPFEDLRADEVAMSWGVNPRNPQVEPEHGTTFAIPLPRVAAAELVRAIETYWWPAMIDESILLDVTVEDEKGTIHQPKPESRSDLAPYLEAFRVAQNGAGIKVDPNAPVLSSSEKARQEVLGPWRAETGARPTAATPGEFGVVLPPSSSVGEDPNTPIVARMRSTRMIIDYWKLDGRSKISLPLRATYIASSSEDRLLRKTEDAGHAGWAEIGEPPIAPYELAAAVSRGIKEALREICDIAQPKIESKNLEARRIGQLLALPGRGQAEGGHKAAKIIVKELEAERGEVTSAGRYSISGSFTLQAVAEQAKQLSTLVKVEIIAKYASDSTETEELPYILSAVGAKAEPTDGGAKSITLKNSIPAKFEFSVPALPGDLPYGVKIAPRVTIIKTGEVTDDFVD